MVERNQLVKVALEANAVSAFIELGGKDERLKNIDMNKIAAQVVSLAYKYKNRQRQQPEVFMPELYCSGSALRAGGAFRMNRELRQKGSRSRIKVRTMAKMFRIIRHRKKQGENIVSVNIGKDVSITI